MFGEVRVDGGGVNTREEVDTGEYFISRNIENMLRVLVSICKRPHTQDSEFSEQKLIPALMCCQSVTCLMLLILSVEPLCNPNAAFSL